MLRIRPWPVVPAMPRVVSAVVNHYRLGLNMDGPGLHVYGPGLHIDRAWLRVDDLRLRVNDLRLAVDRLVLHVIGLGLHVHRLGTEHAQLYAGGRQPDRPVHITRKRSGAGTQCQRRKRSSTCQSAYRTFGGICGRTFGFHHLLLVQGQQMCPVPFNVRHVRAPTARPVTRRSHSSSCCWRL